MKNPSQKCRNLPNGRVLRSWLISLGLFALVLAACSPAASQPTALAATATLAATVTQAPPTASPHPESTPTVNIELLPMSEVAQLLAEGKISYPEHWNNEQRREFSIAMAEYINEKVAGDQAYVEMNFPEIGDTKIAFTTDYGGFWRSSHNTPEDKLDLAGATLPPMFVAGYTNTEDQEMFINAQGQEVSVPKINMPGLGEVSITDLYKMNLNDLKNYVINTMLGASGMTDQAKEITESRRNNHFALPVVMYENADQNKKIYAFQGNAFGDPDDQIPEARVAFRSWRTNNTLMPVIDPGSSQLIGWVSIQQGLRFSGMDSFPFVSGKNPDFFVSQETMDPNTFGYDAEDYFAITLMGKTTSDTFSHPSVKLFLEQSDYIGSATEIQRIMNAKSVVEIMQILSDLRLFVSYPISYLYPAQ